MSVVDFMHLLVPLHGDPRFLRGPLWTSWQIAPTVLIGVLGLAAAYVILTSRWNERWTGIADRQVTGGQRRSFLAGCVVILIALGPPVEDWAALLVSGHMLQHLLLMFLAPPLLLYGTPAWMLAPLLKWKPIALMGYWLTRPAAAFALSSLVIILWHLPVLYDLSLRVEPVHILQHMMYLGTSLLVWWTLLGPLPAWPRSTPLVQCLFLFALTLPSAIVGAFLTFGPVGYYPYYTTVPRMWGIDLATDQQVAGLMMWVLGGVIYLLLVTVIFFRWATREEEGERQGGPLRTGAIERPA